MPNPSASHCSYIAKIGVLAPVLVDFKASEGANWGGFLQPLIEALVGAVSSTHGADIQKLNVLRNDAVSPKPGKVAALRYLFQIMNVEKRFFDYLSSANVEFKCVVFEKLNCTYNCIASLSEAASTCLLERKLESFKEAFKYCTYIISLAKEILKRNKELKTPFLDLETEIVEFIIKCFSAQAQEISATVAVIEAKSSKLLAKLFAASAMGYRDAILHYNAHNVARAGKASWPLVLNAKMKYMAAVSELLQAGEDFQQQAYGNAISRLEISIEHCEEGIEYLGEKYLPEIVKALEQTRTIAKGFLGEVEKDNSMIYHQATTRRSELPIIEKISLVKCLDLANIFDDFGFYSERQLFETFLPQSSLEKLSKYSEEKSKIIRYEGAKVEEFQATFGSLCSKYGLPSSLDDETRDLDEAELSKMRAAAVQANISVEFFVSFQRGIDFSSVNLLSGVIEVLEKEEEDFKKAKPAPHDLHTPYYNEVYNIKGAFSALQPRYKRLLGELDDAFVKDIAEISAGLQESGKKLASEESKALRIQFNEAQRLLKDTEGHFLTFKQVLQKDETIEGFLRDQSEKSDESIFLEELSKFDGSCKQIEHQFEKVSASLRNLEGALSSFFLKWSKSVLSPGTIRLKSALSKAQSLVPSIRAFLADLQEINQKSTVLSEKVSAYVANRVKERTLLIKDIEADRSKRGNASLLQKLNVKSAEPAHAPAASTVPAAGASNDKDHQRMLLDRLRQYDFNK